MAERKQGHALVSKQDGQGFSKTCAAAARPAATRPGGVGAGLCARLAQGFHRVWNTGLPSRHSLIAGLLGLLCGLGPALAAAPCPGPALGLQALAPGVWWLPARPGEADAHNRGQVSNLLAVRDGRRLWLLGSGPSPAFGRALACQLRQRSGLAVTDVISPWARPELVLGVAGLGPVRHWAHAQVAEAMAGQCARCIERLRQRLQAAAADLEPAAALPALPTHRLQGTSGRLGPLRWWLLPRDADHGLTLWRLALPGRAAALWFAPGLLNGSGPPDGRDADLALLQQGAERLQQLAAESAAGAAPLYLGEQGPPLADAAPQRHAGYWAELRRQALAALDRGDAEGGAAPSWPGLDPAWARHAWHGFNWQRMWRQAEPQWLAAPAAPAAAASR